MATLKPHVFQIGRQIAPVLVSALSLAWLARCGLAEPPPWDAARGRETATTLYPAKRSPRDFKWNEKAVHELSRKAPLRITVKRAGGTEVITGRNLELTHISEKVARKGGVLALAGGVILDVRWVARHGRPGGRAYKVRRFEGEWISVQWAKVQGR